ncbi:POTRA domain-containing protein [Archangium sp.]|uniref:POTRA domain-containing protein n=1 Tax=Archangium sp. TaxID=1872627 RepID=UPI002D7257B1|nr:POTRA domain-containing protein [Archangium sp.]HYO60210.1 POTRA domain-containing protein [Archangium sp.]
MLGLLLAGAAVAQPVKASETERMEVRPEAPALPEGPTVTAVELHLPADEDSAGLVELVAVRKGQALSARAVRRSVERLWNSGRFSDIVVRTVDEPEGVRVVFELTLLRKLHRVDVEGNVVLSDEALRAVLRKDGIEEGKPLDEDVLRTALKGLSRAYERQGYNDARIQLTRELVAGGVSLAFTVFEGRPTRVAAVSVTGSSGLPLSELLATLGLRVGGVLDRGGLDAGLERLRTLLRERGYWRASVGQLQLQGEGEAATVVVPISAGPRFSIHFHGNHRFPATLLARMLTYDGSEPLDTPTVARLARRLESFYRYRGFHDVRVEPREVHRPDGEEAVLAFDIEEGHPLRVRRVIFQGNKLLSNAQLREMLTERIRANEPHPATPPRLADVVEMGPGKRRMGPPEWVYDPATVFAEEAYRDAAELMTEAYRERGFLAAQVRFFRLDVDRRSAVAWFDVEEGPQRRVAEVRIEGGPRGFDGRGLVPLKVGEPLSLDAVERGRQALVTELGRQGYLFARAEADPKPADEVVSVLYRLEPGPRVTVGRILIRGTVRTAEEVVRATVRLKEDEVLDPDKLFESQRRLALLNIFRQVTVRLEKPDVPEASKDVVVEVRERPRWEGEVAGGYFLAEGPRLGLDVSRSNVDGRGLNLSGRLKLNYTGWSAQGWEKAALARARCTAVPEECGGPEPYGWVSDFGGRVVLSAVQPRLYGLAPLEVGARLDLIGERVHRPSYLSSRVAAVTGLDWAVTRWLSFGVQYEIEGNRLELGDRQLTTPSRADQERLRFPTGFFILHSLRSSAAVDLRDDPANPRKGLLVSISAELMRDLRSMPTTSTGEPLAARPINGVKVSGNVNGYVPLTSRAVLALSLRAGTIVPLKEDTWVIGSKRFYLGGSSSLRGFREDGILGEDRRTELRRQLADCRSLIHPSGCSLELLTILAGQAPTSEGGQLFTLAKGELRIPVGSSFDVGLFLEAGNLWEDRLKYQLTALRYSTGVGARYVTPVGPLAFDVGFNLDPDETLNEPLVQFHFSIGTF